MKLVDFIYIGWVLAKVIEVVLILCAVYSIYSADFKVLAVALLGAFIAWIFAKYLRKMLKKEGND